MTDTNSPHGALTWRSAAAAKRNRQLKLWHYGVLARQPTLMPASRGAS
jgi:hypothetical protein